MSNPTPSDPAEQERLSALFVNFVLSQTNFALMMMGKVPHPQTGETFHDLESARMFIDQLEMIQVRTQGNLTADEIKMLGNSLTTLRLAFVEAAQNPPADPAKPTAASKPGETGPVNTEEAESKKRFTKKY